MSATPPNSPEFADPARRRFATTRWSVVLAAADSGSGGDAALARLCEAYWEPVYFFLRGLGSSPEDAMDLAQGFFARLLEKRDLRGAGPERGRFRGFLLAAVRHYLANERDRARAQKRGGGATPLSLDFQAAEGHFDLEPAESRTPERLYERRWALATLEAVMARLQAEAEAEGRGALFDRLRNHLTGERLANRYAAVARELGMTEAAVKMAGLRLKRRYRAILRELIGDTVADPREVDEEIRYLIAVLSE